MKNGKISFIVLMSFLIWGCASQPMPNKPFKTLIDFRDQAVVKQKKDYSCGTVALATLFTFYFGDKVGEQELIDLGLAMFSKEKGAEIEKDGFSMLNLKAIGDKREGYIFWGLKKVTLDQLVKMDRPILIHLEIDGYEHFAVLRGIKGDRVFLADPSRGNVRMAVYDFLEEWKMRTALYPDKIDKGWQAPKTHALTIREEETWRPELEAARHALFNP